ncbi:two-component response regulator-like APRR7 [Diospyros lotus]|uniref:two-component response regulator-like APRR7 n=1 Tax=Diospyros lotus TaxID=55363 RepID=UPI00225B7964|nr:two-component response regulator-like APRR7 [Diospyros lotus]
MILWGFRCSCLFTFEVAGYTEILTVFLLLLLQEEISSPLSAQIFELCDPELFPEPLQNSEVASSSNCCYDDNTSYTTNLSFPPDITKLLNNVEKNGNMAAAAAPASSSPSATSATTPAITPNSAHNSDLSVIFDSPEEIQNDISASIDFSSSLSFSVSQFLGSQTGDQFDLPSLQSQVPLPDGVVAGLPQYHQDPVVHLMGPPLPSVLEGECLSLMPSYMRLNSSSPPCSFLDPPSSMAPYLPSNLNTALSADSSGIFTGNGTLYMGNELQNQEMEFQGDNGGIFCPDPLPRIFNSNELQALSNKSQHVVNGGASSTPLGSEISTLEDSSFKVGKLSVEERKEKIHRYMKKRNERNFSKKIKYACRKTLADSRPRVRGRFAKNDEFSEIHRATSSNHEEDTDEDVFVKQEDEMIDSSDIFAHISGVNSFKCNYPIQSWI